MSTAAVYTLKNMLTGEMYIGSSSNIYQRRNQHLSSLRRGKGRHPRLQSNWNQYGESAFQFEILERIKDTTELREREQFWMDRLKPALNILTDAKGPGIYRWTVHRQRKIENGVESHYYKRFLLTAPDGRQMCTDNLSQFCRYFGLERSNLQAVARGKVRHAKGWTCQSIDNPVELKTGPIPRRRSKKYKGFKLTDPEGRVYEVEQLKPFAREHGLTVENLRKVAKKQRLFHKGWDCEFIPFD